MRSVQINSRVSVLQKDWLMAEAAVIAASNFFSRLWQQKVGNSPMPLRKDDEKDSAEENRLSGRSIYSKGLRSRVTKGARLQETDEARMRNDPMDYQKYMHCVKEAFKEVFLDLFPQKYKFKRNVAANKGLLKTIEKNLATADLVNIDRVEKPEEVVKIRKSIMSLIEDMLNNIVKAYIEDRDLPDEEVESKLRAQFRWAVKGDPSSPLKYIKKEESYQPPPTAY